MRTGSKGLVSGNTFSALPRNDIDFNILSDLTDQDLEKIGVTSVGHRRKLLRAIANFKVGEQITPTVAGAVAAILYTLVVK